MLKKVLFFQACGQMEKKQSNAIKAVKNETN